MYAKYRIAGVYLEGINVRSFRGLRLYRENNTHKFNIACMQDVERLLFREN